MFDALVLSAALHAPSEQPHQSTAAVQFLNCVIAHESHGNPRAENPSSTASGLFQFIDGTWQHYAENVPSARKYSHAAHAPAKVQWEVALLAIRWNGHLNWRGTHCGYGT